MVKPKKVVIEKPIPRPPARDEPVYREVLSCGATLRILDNSNAAIDPTLQALIVSNHRSDLASVGSTGIGFNGRVADPDAFRIEVEDSTRPARVDVRLQVGARAARTLSLRRRSGDRYRGFFLRLVSDGVDDGARGDQTVIAALGDPVVVRYSNGPECEDTLTITVGRPPGENDNQLPDQSRHDIRQIRLNVVVFGRRGRARLARSIDADDGTIELRDASDVHDPPARVLIRNEVISYDGIAGNRLTGCRRGVDGTQAARHPSGRRVTVTTRTPALTRDEVIADLERVDQRLAQATIRVLQPVAIDLGGGQGRALPAALLDGFRPNRSVVRTPTASERAIIELKDGNAATIDVFYVEEVLGSAVATAYPPMRNRSGEPRLVDFTVVGAKGKRPFTLAHELMHILLDSAHRTREPSVSLFRSPTSGANRVRATKRVGPNGSTGVGATDTRIIRGAAQRFE